jgi:YVTN family beta-propeller protein
VASIIAALTLAACGPIRDAPAPDTRTRSDGRISLAVYLEQVPAHGAETEIVIDGAWARAADGTRTPLTLTLDERVGPSIERDRLLATADVPDGSYEGLVFALRDPTIGSGAERTALRMDGSEVVLPVPFRVTTRGPVVVHVRFDPAESLHAQMTFRPDFSAHVADDLVPGLIAAISLPDADLVVLMDKLTGRVHRLLRTGRRPSGLAIDVDRRRLYVAVAGDDAVEIYDLPDGSLLDRVQLARGDRTIDVALSPDGETVLAANPGSGSVSVIEALSAFERRRVRAGDEPFEIVVSPNGTRAFIVNRRSDTVTVFGLPAGVAIASLATEARPTRLALDEAGQTLYVAQQRSSNLAVYDVETLSSAGRVLVGPGATALLLDEIRGRLYIARRGATEIQAFEPGSQLPLDEMDVGSDVTFMTLDTESNRIVLVESDARTVRTIDAVRYRELTRADLPGRPFEAALFQQP